MIFLSGTHQPLNKQLQAGRRCFPDQIPFQVGFDQQNMSRLVQAGGFEQLCGCRGLHQIAVYKNRFRIWHHMPESCGFRMPNFFVPKYVR